MNGEKHNDELQRVASVSMKFDAYIGRAIRGRIRNAIRDYMKQMDDFPLGHENEIENVPASWEADPTNQHRIKVREDEVYLQDERLADAMRDSPV